MINKAGEAKQTDVYFFIQLFEDITLNQKAKLFNLFLIISDVSFCFPAKVLLRQF
jgi:hypothetical protein